MEQHPQRHGQKNVHLHDNKAEREKHQQSANEPKRAAHATHYRSAYTMNIDAKERELRRPLTAEPTTGRRRRKPRQRGDQHKSRKEEMKCRCRVAGGTCKGTRVDCFRRVDTVLLRFLVIAPFKLNGSFRFSGHCTAHAPNVSYASSAYSQRGEAHFVFL
jgi:hypothetical protein